MGRPNWTTCSIARRIQAPVIEGIPRTTIRVMIGLVVTSTTFNPSVFMCNNRISHTFHDHEGILFVGDKDPNPSSSFVVFNSKFIINRW
ncbi:hypothetical protein Hanom_Chr16g01427151 [Helianthus anomalus]